MKTDTCSGSVTGHGSDKNGKCPWCGQKRDSAIPKPPLGATYLTVIDEAYGYVYDPDYGSARPKRGYRD